MTTAIRNDRDQPAPPAGEERVLLHNVSWTTYEQLLTDLISQSAPRLTYDQGALEIMSPGPLHETITDIIETLIKRYAEEKNINIRCLRSTTFVRKSFQCGFEADSCFYVSNEARIRGKEKLDLKEDPPPDLVIEVDISGSSIDKFPIFAQMRVPEVWVHDGNELIIYLLQDGEYQLSQDSLSFTEISSNQISEFIQQSKDLSSTEFTKILRGWLQSF